MPALQDRKHLMGHHVLVSCLQMQARMGKYKDAFAARGITYDSPSVDQQLREDGLLPTIDRYDAVIAGDDHFTAKVLERGSRLKVISKWGVGIDNIDLEAAQRLKIEVLNTPGMFGDEVADVCVGYIIMLARGLQRIDQAVREGGWLKVEGTSLRGKVLGVVGLGSIGRALVDRANALGMEVLGTDADERAMDRATGDGIKTASLDEVLETSDCLSLNCPLTLQNRHMIAEPQLSRMKSGAFLINTARGELVDEAAVAASLELGRLRGVALDVFEVEPLPSDSPLRGLPNCILGSHNASNTAEAVDRTSERAVINLLAALGHPAL